MKLAAVVVFYNPSEKNVKNISNYLDSVDKLYVIDNSDDNVVRLINNKKIQYIKLGENKGVAHALNLGAISAIDDGFQYLLTLDQDSLITNRIVKKMMNFLSDNRDNTIGLISPFHDIGYNSKAPNNEIEDIIEVMTSGNIINLNAYKKIGGFKDWLFIDCVDTEYCMNLHKNGYKVLRINSIIMKHSLGELKVHRLFGRKFDCYNHGPMRRYYIARNNLYINQMYGDIYPDYCKKLLRIQRGQIKRIIAFEKNKVKKLRMMLKGYKDYKKGIKGKYNRQG